MNFATYIVTKCHFSFIFNHSRAPNKSWNIIDGVLGKSWIFLSVKEGEKAESSHFKLCRNDCGLIE